MTETAGPTTTSPDVIDPAILADPRVADDDPARVPVLRLTPGFKANSPYWFAKLREQGPIARVILSNGMPAWAVVGYEEGKLAFTHPNLLKDPTPSADLLESYGFTSNQAGVGAGGNMLESDPPDHTRLRRLVAGAFSPRRTQALAPRIQQISDTLIDAIAPLGRADLVTTFTTPLPVAVIGELLGVPEADRDQFRIWTGAALKPVAAEQRAAMLSLNEYLAALVSAKRRDPGDDLLSDLIATRAQDDGRLSEAELVGTAVLLLIAGHDTTVHLLGNALIGLFRQPDQIAKLQADPGLLPGAVEEFLRFDPPVEVSPIRYASADFEFAGAPIHRGDLVVVTTGSASRDAPQTDDVDPSVLNVTRQAPRHLAFGHGIHHCLGAPLARLEAATAIGTLLRRLPDIAPAVSLDDIPRLPAGMMRGPLELPVTFQPRTGR